MDLMNSETDGDERVLDVEYSSRALSKYNRSTELFRSLERAVGHWNNEHLLMAPARSPYDGEQ